jgi:hypothetical protein
VFEVPARSSRAIVDRAARLIVRDQALDDENAWMQEKSTHYEPSAINFHLGEA